MLSQAVKYFIKTNCKMIHNDVAEYKSLCRECENLYAQLKNARKELVSLFDIERKNKLTCINLVLLPRTTNILDVCSYYFECPAFKDSMGQEKVCGRCDKCETYNQNRSFFTACQCYEAMRQRKSDFWREKFGLKK